MEKLYIYHLCGWPRLFRALVSLIIVGSCWTMIGSVAVAEPVLSINWEDLAPPRKPFDNPFKELTQGQLLDLASVARLREQAANGKMIASRERNDRSAKEKSLLSQGINVDRLLAARARILERHRRESLVVVPSLDGKQVRIAGYLLPIEFQGTKVTQFLLVPYVGACIHVPPPPANQIVHVKFSEGHHTSGLFDPVWVNGRISTGLSSQNVHLVDGEASIPVGYRLFASTIEPYKD